MVPVSYLSIDFSHCAALNLVTAALVAGYKLSVGKNIEVTDRSVNP